MHLSGADNRAQSSETSFAQAYNFQANFSYVNVSQSQTTNGHDQQTSSYSSAVTLSISISAIHVTTDFLATEKGIDDGAVSVPDKGQPREKGIENSLQALIKELKENDGLTAKVAKRLFKLVGSLNVARGTDKKLGDFNKEDRQEVRTARQRINDFFKEKHSGYLVDENLTNFIKLVAKLETLREFILRSTDLLSALKGEPQEESEDGADGEQPPQINIEA
ncbi:MAG: hypothetical protein JKY45_05990 [Emcibacter sp.]|nr:hypothetical protein [Emcibacter sp.]